MAKRSDMRIVKQTFDDEFGHWNIELPIDDLEQRRRGKIVKAGWAIWYLFGEDDHGEYFDYYSSHRHPGDTHLRIYADGRTEVLPSISPVRPGSSDPEEDARFAQEFYAENARIMEMLEAKGFGLSGDEPGGVQINTFLRLNDVGPAKKSKE
jgi:hypothetical protein